MKEINTSYPWKYHQIKSKFNFYKWAKIPGWEAVLLHMLDTHFVPNPWVPLGRHQLIPASKAGLPDFS
jgi:hypothetical protein